MIDAVLKRRGTAAFASDPEIFAGIDLLAATEGILTEPAGGTTIACLEKMAANGRFAPDDTVVASITGNGLKTTDALQGRYTQERAVRPRLADFDAYLRELDGIVETELAAAGGN